MGVRPVWYSQVDCIAAGNRAMVKARFCRGDPVAPPFDVLSALVSIMVWRDDRRKQAHPSWPHTPMAGLDGRREAKRDEIKVLSTVSRRDFMGL